MEYMCTIDILVFKRDDYLILIIYLQELKQQTGFSPSLRRLSCQFQLAHRELIFCNLQ